MACGSVAADPCYRQRKGDGGDAVGPRNGPVWRLLSPSPASSTGAPDPNSMTIPHRFDYRPTTDWGIPAGLLANIKGQRRRQLITRVAATGDLGDPDPRWLAEAVSEEEQNALAMIRPSFMGASSCPAICPEKSRSHASVSNPSSRM